MTKAKAIDLPPDEVLEAMNMYYVSIHPKAHPATKMRKALSCPAFLAWLEGVRTTELMPTIESKAYHCPHCGNWHLTAHGTKNKKRFQEFKRRRK